MGCDYYESINLEYTYTIGDEIFTKDIEIYRDKKWIFSEETYEKDLEQALSKESEVIYTKDFPLDFLNRIKLEVKKDHLFNMENPNFTYEVISDLDFDTYLKVSKLLGNNDTEDSVKYRLNFINKNKLRELNFLELFNLKKIRYYSYCSGIY